MMPRLTEALEGLPLTPTFSAGVATLLVLASHVDEVLEVADDLTTPPSAPARTRPATSPSAAVSWVLSLTRRRRGREVSSRRPRLERSSAAGPAEVSQVSRGWRTGWPLPGRG